MTALYYRRTGQPHAFPATDPGDIEITSEPQAVGIADGDWRAIEVDESDVESTSVIDAEGGMTDPWLIADAMIVELAILKFFGVELPVSSIGFTNWEPVDLDDSGAAAHEALCDAVDLMYGYDVANGQRAALAPRLSREYLDSHSIEI